jgi:hypothetical protein
VRVALDSVSIRLWLLLYEETPQGQAQADGDRRAALVAIHEARATLELLARLWYWPGHNRTGEPGWMTCNDVPAEVQVPTAEVREMPPDLKESLGRWLLRRRTERLARQRTEIEERVRSLMPTERSDPDD